MISGAFYPLGAAVVTFRQADQNEPRHDKQKFKDKGNYYFTFLNQTLVLILLY